MNDRKKLHLEFTFHASNPAHQTVLLRIRSALETQGVSFEMAEVDADLDSASTLTTVPAVPCLKRVEPLPERILIGNFEKAEEILVALGIRGTEVCNGWRPESERNRRVPGGENFFVYAEDDDNVLLLVRAALKRLKADHLLVHCSDGESLLEFLERACQRGNKPRFVLLDVRMPRVGGLEALQRIKDHPVLSSLPVVIFSSDNTEQEKEIAQRLGAVACRPKPSSFTALCGELQELLSQFELQSP